MGLEENVRHQRSLDQVGPRLAEHRVGVGADVSVWPTIEAAPREVREVIGYQPVAQPVTLVHHHIELGRGGMHGDAHRVAQAGGERRERPLAGRQFLHGGTRGRLDRRIGAATHRYEQVRAIVRERDVAGRVPLPVAERALGGDRLRR